MLANPIINGSINPSGEHGTTFPTCFSDVGNTTLHDTRDNVETQGIMWKLALQFLYSHSEHLSSKVIPPTSVMSHKSKMAKMLSSCHSK
jgi:hypothetical protein